MACNTISARRTILASLFAIGLAGGAAAQGIGNAGGGATLSGGGDDQQITYSPGGAGVPRGRLVTFGGSHGDGPHWNYGPSTDGNPGREAWMTGGGDNTQVVYVSPHQRPDASPRREMADGGNIARVAYLAPRQRR
jgi:hypothetical protein